MPGARPPARRRPPRDLGRERLGRRRGRVGELRPTCRSRSPLGLEPLFAPRFEALGALDELPQLLEAVRAPCLRLGKLVPGCAGLSRAHARRARARRAGEAARPRRRRRAGRAGRRAATSAALLELAGHGEQAVDGERELLARHGASPRIRARPPVGEDPTGGDEALLAFGPKLARAWRAPGRRGRPREVELRLDVGLGAAGADDSPRRRARRAGARTPGPGSSSPRRSRP